jgi:transposase
MKEHSNERVVKVVGIDLAKRSFHVYGVSERGQKVISKSFTRTRLREFMAHLPACLVAMEACGSAHYWARRFRDQGHEVRLIAPQFVKPFVKSNKNDAIDAEAIGEAARRPSMRFVAVKRVEQQEIQALHRMRG